jgi:DNA-binding IclR family transcriptional regulator
VTEQAKSGNIQIPATDVATRHPKGVSTVENAIAVLKALPTKEPALGVNEIARRVKLHKSTVSRILATLERHGFIQRNADNGRVSLGFGLITLVSPLLANLDVVKIGGPLLDRLVVECGESVSLSMWSGSEVVMVAQTIGDRAVTHVARHGGRVPGHCTAGGKALLANLPKQELESFLANDLRRYTPNTITDREQLLHQLGEIRTRGYAINDQEHDLESCGIAACVRNARGAVIAVLSAAVPKHRFLEHNQAQLIEIIMRYAIELSARMGYRDSND